MKRWPADTPPEVADEIERVATLYGQAQVRVKWNEEKQDFDWEVLKPGSWFKLPDDAEEGDE